MTPTIDRQITVIKPNGRRAKVNCLRFNLAHCADGYVQLADTSWIKARLCRKVQQR